MLYESNMVITSTVRIIIYQSATYAMNHKYFDHKFNFTVRHGNKVVAEVIYLCWSKFCNDFFSKHHVHVCTQQEGGCPVSLNVPYISFDSRKTVKAATFQYVPEISTCQGHGHKS